MTRFFRKRFLVVALACAAAAFFAFPQSASAQTGVTDVFGGVISNGVAIVVGGLLWIWSSFAGLILLLLVKGLLYVASWNTFIQVPAVIEGWKIIRDVCNMFFVLILLAIAIGTILQQEKYHYSKMLVPFVSAAIFINFSKTICGLIIDASQVVMLTFVNAFSEGAGGNFFILLGAQNYWGNIQMKSGESFFEAGMEAFFSFILVAIVVTVADVVVFVMIMVLVARVVMLWFLIVLSPLAFALTVLPSTQKYSERWWKDFSNHVIVGPAMAFFLWLSLAVVQSASIDPATGPKKEKYTNNQDINIVGQADKNTQNLKLSGMTEETGIDVGTSGIGSLGGIVNYILGIGMLLGTLMITQELGVAGSKVAGAAAGGVSDVLSGKKGLVPWRTAMGEAFGAFESRTMKPWKERGQRAGAYAGQVADIAISSSIGWMGTKQDQARTKKRISEYREHRIEDETKQYTEGEELGTKSVDELRARLAKEKVDSPASVAILKTIADKRGINQLDEQEIAKMDGMLEFLESRGAHTEADKIRMTVKSKNPEFALEHFYRIKDKDGNEIFDRSRFVSDVKERKISTGVLTKEFLEKKENAGLLYDIAASTKDTKELDELIKPIQQSAIRAGLSNHEDGRERLSQYGNVTHEQKLAFAKVTKRWKTAFDIKDIGDRDFLADEVFNRDKMEFYNNRDAETMRDPEWMKFTTDGDTRNVKENPNANPLADWKPGQKWADPIFTNEEEKMGVVEGFDRRLHIDIDVEKIVSNKIAQGKSEDEARTEVFAENPELYEQKKAKVYDEKFKIYLDEALKRPGASRENAYIEAHTKTKADVGEDGMLKIDIATGEGDVTHSYYDVDKAGNKKFGTSLSRHRNVVTNSTRANGWLNRKGEEVQAWDFVGAAKQTFDLIFADQLVQGVDPTMADKTAKKAARKALMLVRKARQDQVGNDRTAGVHWENAESPTQLKQRYMQTPGADEEIGEMIFEEVGRAVSGMGTPHMAQTATAKKSIVVDAAQVFRKDRDEAEKIISTATSIKQMNDNLERFSKEKDITDIIGLSDRAPNHQTLGDVGFAGLKLADAIKEKKSKLSASTSQSDEDSTDGD